MSNCPSNGTPWYENLASLRMLFFLFFLFKNPLHHRWNVSNWVDWSSAIVWAQLEHSLKPPFQTSCDLETSENAWIHIFWVRLVHWEVHFLKAQIRLCELRYRYFEKTQTHYSPHSLWQGPRFPSRSASKAAPRSCRTSRIANCISGRSCWRRSRASQRGRKRDRKSSCRWDRLFRDTCSKSVLCRFFRAALCRYRNCGSCSSGSSGDTDTRWRGISQTRSVSGWLLRLACYKRKAKSD